MTHIRMTLRLSVAVLARGSRLQARPTSPRPRLFLSNSCTYPCRNLSSAASARARPDQVKVLGTAYAVDDWTNVTPGILEKTGRNLLHQPAHPLRLVKRRIADFFYHTFPGAAAHSCPLFTVVDNLSPVVSTRQNFDELLIPEGHVSRSKSDNYYINKETVLRAHTSSHQNELMRSGLSAFLMFGDVYRRDTIDATHFPVFHQCEGVRLFRQHDLFPQSSPSEEEVNDQIPLFVSHDRTPEHQETLSMEATKMLEFDLKSTLEDLMKHLMNDSRLKMRWTSQYFPFTHPSWELEIEYEGEWLEILGCGVVEQQIVKNSGCTNMAGWAFGIGLERVAMLLYKIPDIRLFWSKDPRFLDQFIPANKDLNASITFQPFSKFTPLINDVSFWVPGDFQENDFFDIVRSEAGDLIENVQMIDKYQCQKTGRKSQTYRLTFRHFEKVLCQEEVNGVKSNIENLLVNKLRVEIR